ncbi:MAG: recombinase family protein [Firmicutes bacterium]|nr:recombinase family protein [Bacillota bacterium]
MLEIVADWYSKQLSEKVTRGLYQRAEQGKYNGGQMPLGFKKGEDGHYALDPQTAPVIKEIFQRISEGETAVSVMEDLNKRGIKTSQGKPFTKNSLYSILRNERYAGVYIYGDIRIEDGMPRIVSNELFDEVQDVLTTHKHRGRRRPKEDDYILTGKLFCGKCKSPMYGLSGTSSHKGIIHRYYSCKEKPKNCDKKNVRKEKIEKLIVSECQKLISDEIIEALIKSIEKANKSDQQGPEIIRLQKEVKSVDLKIEKLLSQIEDGVTSERIIERLKKREDELQVLKKQLRLEETKQKILDTGIVRRFLKDLRKGNVESQNYRKTLVKIFVDKIYLYDDYFRIILSYSPGDKTSDNESEDIERYLNGQPLENSALEAQIQPIKGIVRKYPNTVHQKPLKFQRFFICSQLIKPPLLYKQVHV